MKAIDMGDDIKVRARKAFYFVSFQTWTLKICLYAIWNNSVNKSKEIKEIENNDKNHVLSIAKWDGIQRKEWKNYTPVIIITGNKSATS